VVLYCVPQGNVLVYYDKQTVNGDDIRGFVDLRKATRVQQISQVGWTARLPLPPITQPASTHSARLAPLRGRSLRFAFVCLCVCVCCATLLLWAQVINKKERPVLEIRTATRTYLMAPDTINKVGGGVVCVCVCVCRTPFFRALFPRSCSPLRS
jgi:hypothetical protein